MGNGYTLPQGADAMLTNEVNPLAVAGGDFQDAEKTLQTAKMKKGLLGMLAGMGNLETHYNNAIDNLNTKIGQAIKSVDASIQTIEQTVHDYNNVDADSMNKIVFAGADLTDRPTVK